MNNPLEFILRKQKMAQGGRIGLYEGGPSDREGFGFGNFGKQGRSAPDSLGRPGGGNKNQQNNNVQNIHSNYKVNTTPAEDDSKQEQTTTVDVTPNVKQQSFLDRIFSGIFTKPTVKEDFVNKVKYNPKLNRFIKETYNVASVDDLTDAQVQAINDYNNLSYDEIKDALSNMTMSAITNPLGTTYNTATMAALGLPGIGMTGMVNALANIAMQKPSYAKNPQNFAFTGPMVDEQGNLISQDFSYTGPMSTNPAVNQQIANIQNISGVTGLTAAQQAEAVAKAMSSAETGGMMSFGGDGQNKQLPQTTAQDTVQTYMDSLTESETDRYNELIRLGYTDEYARAYLGML
jgi:hypothetical protein